MRLEPMFRSRADTQKWRLVIYVCKLNSAKGDSFSILRRLSRSVQGRWKSNTKCIVEKHRQRSKELQHTMGWVVEYLPGEKQSGTWPQA